MFLDKVVIGNSLKSIEFASKEQSFLIRNDLNSPPIFDKQKKEWHHKVFHLGLSGKDIYHGKINSIRISEDLIKVNSQLGNFKYQYNFCHVFDYSNLSIEDNEMIKHNTDTYDVVDWLQIKQGADFSDIDCIPVQDSFIKEILFYKSGRVDFDSNFKDIVVKSTVSSKDINDFQYSLTMVKFYCEQCLSEKYNQIIKLESVKREKRFLNKPVYKSSKKVKFYD